MPKGECFLNVYRDVMMDGATLSPRGKLVKEIENYQFEVTDRFTSFKHRRLNLAYLKAEMLWYLTADPYSDMITDHAQIWTDIQQPDGRFFSNYGYYWFGEQGGFAWCLEELLRDRDSRRACIPMLNASHIFADNKDVVCTECITFRIRDNALNMTVNMRSNDAVWGLTNDVACFSFLHEMLARALGVNVGTYVHKADSMHIYERHFDMATKIIEDWTDGWETILCPPITDPFDLIAQEYRSPFGKWLTGNPPY